MQPQDQVWAGGQVCLVLQQHLVSAAPLEQRNPWSTIPFIQKRCTFAESCSCDLFWYFTVTYLFYCSPVYFFSRLIDTDKPLSSRVLHEHINFTVFLGPLQRIVAKLDLVCVMVGHIIGVSMNGWAALLSCSRLGRGGSRDTRNWQKIQFPVVKHIFSTTLTNTAKQTMKLNLPEKALKG